MRTGLPLLGDDVTKGALGPFAVRNVVQAKHGIHGQVTVGGGWMDGVAWLKTFSAQHMAESI